MRIPLVALGVAFLVLVACGGASYKAGDLSADYGSSQVPVRGPLPPIPPDSAFDTTREFSDTRRLLVGACPKDCRLGPLASIHPRRRAAQWTTAQRDSGEWIARITSEGPYPKFNLHGGDTVYWAVVKSGDSLLSIFHSTVPNSRDVVTRTQVYPHRERFFNGLAFARFIWSDKDDFVWGTCDGGACCQSDGFH